MSGLDFQGSIDRSVLPRHDVGFPPEVVHHLHLARHRRVPRVLAAPVRRRDGVRVGVRVLRQLGLARGDGLGDLPGLDDLKSAGLLRKGQVIGGLVDAVDDEELDEEGEDDSPDLLEDAFLDADPDLAEEESDQDDA